MDAYGNVTHTMASPPARLATHRGDGERRDRRLARDAGARDLSPLVFAVATPLTEAQHAVARFLGFVHLKKHRRARIFSR